MKHLYNRICIYTKSIIIKTGDINNLDKINDIEYSNINISDIEKELYRKRMQKITSSYKFGHIMETHTGRDFDSSYNNMLSTIRMNSKSLFDEPNLDVNIYPVDFNENIIIIRHVEGSDSGFKLK